MRVSYLFALVFSLSFIYSCSQKKNIISTANQTEDIITEEIILDDVVIMPDTRSYRPSETRINDLIHTNLNVSFDFQKRSVLGTVELDLKPYFYPTNELVLDAKGMKISSVAMVEANGEKPLKYSYDELFLTIDLERTYTKQDKYRIKIVYEAFPEDAVHGGSTAITSAQGIYFINPDSTEINKPTQIWTQGETESNSVWFPTIDSPNERMSQEVSITVPEAYKTLSNGELIFSNYNGDGTRTDYWKQELQHAPYLLMLAVGDFTVITESWKNAEREDIAVDYYMEPEYSPYAKDIFGRTPQMLSFYSEVLGYPYPWDKYSQVIVRDFVSGAMENTTAVIHGDFLNATDRELLDGDNEAIIAHELFHHWFGDLVTCESWSNLPLNESFATYGEYLWIEHADGRDAADLHSMNSMDGYLAESETKQVDLIRFYYDDKEQMFDGHSYNKGGRVLHMLRYFLGDDAFFAGLNLYLNEHEFESVEIHQLRLAMEEISGKDLNWFFNQWFLGSGHPDLEINYNYNPSASNLTIEVSQLQDKLFRLPLHVLIHTDNGTRRERIDIRKAENSFTFDLDAPLSYVSFDADKVLLGTKVDNRPNEWWSRSLKPEALFLEKYEGIRNCKLLGDSASLLAVDKMFNDSFWKIRLEAVKCSKSLSPFSPSLESKLKDLALNDPKSAVRAKAIDMLLKVFPENDYAELLSTSLKDPSYRVMAEALEQITEKDVNLGLTKAKALEPEKGSALQGSIAEIYAKHGGVNELNYMNRVLIETNGFAQYNMTGTYGEFLSRQSSSVMQENITALEEIAANGSIWWVRLSGYNALESIRKEAVKRSENLESPDAIAAGLAKHITERVTQLSEAETDEQLKSILNN